MIRIFVVDDDLVLRQGLKVLLSQDPDLQIIGEASDGEEAVASAEVLHPDLMLMDIEMPGIGGIEAARQITKRLQNVKVLMLTSHDSEGYFFDALRAGASGYILKRSDADEIISAIKSVEMGLAYLSPAMTKILIEEHQKSEADRKGPSALSPRESEVFELLAKGKTNKEIGDALTISIKTVQTHRSHLMEKLNLKTRTDLVKYAIRNGLISLHQEG